MHTAIQEKISPNAKRVEEQTADELNRKIEQQSRVSIAGAALAGQHLIDERLRLLDHEWDTERTLQTNFATVTIAGLIIGFLISRPWRLLGGLAAGFMIQHSLQGWCPPLPLIRRLRFRTAREIDRERYALKAMRGDFRGTKGNATAALQAAIIR